MDDVKCNALKTELAAQPEPQLVSIERFFDGNDDVGSIGCNLLPHPGVDVFRETLAGLLRRPDVQGVYAQITELDPGPGSWPFTDTAQVMGAISTAELRKAVRALRPDEVGTAEELGISPLAAGGHGARVLAVWWD